MMQSRVARPVKQAASVSQKSDVPRWQGPTNIAIFVRCLHLLNLDRLSDWPGITEAVFATKTAQQNLQARIKAAEWSLYRLFEIYDPKETQTKLRPFFPPLAPLQSLNLRAALYRALTELKKNGPLGRDVVLRKTMLDECKGDKFEEVISTFALLVLRKVHPTRFPNAKLEQIETVPMEHVVPLILAYKVSLQRNLRLRKAISKDNEAFLAKLALAHEDLKQRHEKAQQGFHSVEEEDLIRFATMVKTSWVGDDRWSKILLEGRLRPIDLLMPLESSTTESSVDRSQTNVPSEDLAADLEDRIATYEGQLKKWKTFHASLRNQKNLKQPTSRMQHAPEKIAVRFDKHKELTFNPQLAQGSAEERLEPYHASILENIEEELTSLANSTAPPYAVSALPQMDAGTIIESDEGTQPDGYQLLVQASTRLQQESVNTPSPIPVDTAMIEEVEVRPAHQLESSSSDPSSPLDRSVMNSDVKRATTPTNQPDSLQNDSLVLPPLPDLPDRRGTLLERTRQSMSLHPNPPTAPSRQSKQPRFSEVFPVNQFETPGRKIKAGTSRSPRSGSSTPRDRLFSEEADYASVFKSRPRIAVSPSLSPERSPVSMDTFLAEGVDDLTLDNDLGSPSRR